MLGCRSEIFRLKKEILKVKTRCNKQEEEMRRSWQSDNKNVMEAYYGKKSEGMLRKKIMQQQSMLKQKE